MSTVIGGRNQAQHARLAGDGQRAGDALGPADGVAVRVLLEERLADAVARDTGDDRPWAGQVAGRGGAGPRRRGAGRTGAGAAARRPLTRRGGGGGGRGRVESELRDVVAGQEGAVQGDAANGHDGDEPDDDDGNATVVHIPPFARMRCFGLDGAVSGTNLKVR